MWARGLRQWWLVGVGPRCLRIVPCEEKPELLAKVLHAYLAHTHPHLWGYQGLIRSWRGTGVVASCFLILGRWSVAAVHKGPSVCVCLREGVTFSNFCFVCVLCGCLTDSIVLSSHCPDSMTMADSCACVCAADSRCVRVLKILRFGVHESVCVCVCVCVCGHVVNGDSRLSQRL